MFNTQFFLLPSKSNSGRNSGFPKIFYLSPCRGLDKHTHTWWWVNKGYLKHHKTPMVWLNNTPFSQQKTMAYKHSAGDLDGGRGPQTWGSWESLLPWPWIGGGGPQGGSCCIDGWARAQGRGGRWRRWDVLSSETGPTKSTKLQRTNN